MPVNPEEGLPTKGNYLVCDTSGKFPQALLNPGDLAELYASASFDSDGRRTITVFVNAEALEE